jgi:hypothetical protein
MLAFDISCLKLAGRKDFKNFAPLNGISFCSIQTECKSKICNSLQTFLAKGTEMLQ